MTTLTIYRIAPTFCQITDAMLGNEAVAVQTGYPVDWKDRAAEKCAELNEAHADADWHFVVAEHGKPFTRRAPIWPVKADVLDDCPF